MMKLSKFSKLSGMSYQHLHKLWKQGKLNAQQIRGPHTTIFVNEENPFEVTKDQQNKPKRKYLDEIEINFDKCGPESNLELLIYINKIILKKELESREPDMVKVNRCTKELLQASKLLLQHQIDDVGIVEGIY